MRTLIVVAIFLSGLLVGVGIESMYVDADALGECGVSIAHVSQLRGLLSCYSMRLDNLDSHVYEQDKSLLELRSNMDALKVDFYNNGTLPAPPDEPKLNSTETR